MQKELNTRIAAIVIGFVALIVLGIGWHVIAANSGPNLDASAVTQPTQG